MSKLTKEMWTHVAARVNQLKKMPYSALARLPQYSDVEKICNGKAIRLATWIDEEEGQLGVAVHAAIKGILGSETMVHDGFFMKEDGTIMHMPFERQLKDA